MKPPKGLAISLYRGMAEIREFELKAREIFRSGRMPGFIHLYVGEEAVGVGVCAQLRTDDYVASTHRGHGHALAKGISPRSVMAEWSVRCRGREFSFQLNFHLANQSPG